MIIGIGNDIVDIRRIEEMIDRYGDRFLNRIFTAYERERSERRAARAASYAKRFAAKEACAKALGTGFAQGVGWRNIGVINLPSGAPGLALDGGAARRLSALMPPGKTAQMHLSITDEPPLAQAFVIISATDKSPASDVCTGV